MDKNERAIFDLFFTTSKRRLYYFEFEFLRSIKSVAFLLQLRLFDVRGLQNKIGGASKSLLWGIIKKTKAFF